MAVLIEAISLVIRREAIDRTYPGGLERFAGEVPNATLCADDALVRVGFLTASEAAEFAELIEARGLVHLRAGEAADFCRVDQVDGPTDPCRWVSFGTFAYGRGGRISACWFCDNPWIQWGATLPDVVMELVTPADWTYERSLSWALDAGKARRTVAAPWTPRQTLPVPPPSVRQPIIDGPAVGRLH
jgi:hypothetical protein